MHRKKPTSSRLSSRLYSGCANGGGKESRESRVARHVAHLNTNDSVAAPRGILPPPKTAALTTTSGPSRVHVRRVVPASQPAEPALAHKAVRELRRIQAE